MKIEEINITELHLFRENPFKVRKDEAFNELVESVSTDGIYEPLIVCPDKDESGYIIVSGQRRFEAAKTAGLETVPAVVHDMDKDKMIIAIVDNNICSRDILPSEKAFGYKLKYDAMKRTAGRPLNNSCQVGTNLRTDKKIAEFSDDSARQIQRYIRLTSLIPELLDMVDKGKIAFTPAVEMSFLTVDEQKALAFEMEGADATPSLSQAQRMRKLSSENMLTQDTIENIIAEEKGNQKETLKIPVAMITKYMGRYADRNSMEVYVQKACEYYAKYLIKMRNRDAR